jgi:hypothetical protein
MLTLSLSCIFIHYQGDDNPEKRRQNKRKQEKAKAG